MAFLVRQPGADNRPQPLRPRQPGGELGAFRHDMALADRAHEMLRDALDLYRDSPRATNWLRRHVDRLAEPLRVAVAGQPAVAEYGGAAHRQPAGLTARHPGKPSWST